MTKPRPIQRPAPAATRCRPGPVAVAHSPAGCPNWGPVRGRPDRTARRRLAEDELRHELQRQRHEEDHGQLRQQMAPKDVRRGGPGGFRSSDVIVRFRGGNHRPHEARGTRPADCAHGAHDHDERLGRRERQRHCRTHRKQRVQPGQREREPLAPEDDRVDRSTRISGERSKQNPEREQQAHGRTAIASEMRAPTTPARKHRGRIHRCRRGTSPLVPRRRRGGLSCGR